MFFKSNKGTEIITFYEPEFADNNLAMWFLLNTVFHSCENGKKISIWAMEKHILTCHSLQISSLMEVT